jgi:two-component system, LytTR family, sensor kinase
MLGPSSRWSSAAAFAGAWTLVALVFAALSHAVAVSNGMRPNTGVTVGQHLLRFYIWAALSLPVFRFARRYSLGPRETRARRLLLHLPALAAFSLAHVVVLTAVLWYSGLFTAARVPPDVLAYYRLTFFGSLYSALLQCALVFAAAHALIFYRDYRTGEARAAELRAQLAQAQLRALKMQLHPHFLFNALHSISALVLQDPPRANRMIARLGDFLRLTLEHSEEQIVPLREEVEFLRCYLEIEQVRFSDRLAVEYEIGPSALAARVPHLILQPVVENAIRHAVAPRSAPARLRIEAARDDGMLLLSVSDDGPGGAADPADARGERPGLGLANVRARLEQIYGDAYRFEAADAPGGGFSVSISLPFEPETGARGGGGAP